MIRLLKANGCHTALLLILSTLRHSRAQQRHCSVFAGMEDGLLRTFHVGLADPMLARQRQVGTLNFSNWSGIGFGFEVIVSFLLLNLNQESIGLHQQLYSPRKLSSPNSVLPAVRMWQVVVLISRSRRVVVVVVVKP